MNKSIYEEALLKLREIAEKLTRKQWIELTNNIELIRNNLQQAHKQEKLLKLYQRLYKDFDDLTLNEQLEIEKQINELEREIKK